MPINAHPEYLEAEKNYHRACSDEERLKALEEMVRWVPKHKGAESLRENLSKRYKKLKEVLKGRSKKFKSKKGIKKEDLQAVFVGLTNSGKSSLLRALTNAEPKITSYGFATKEPLTGTLHYNDCNIQLLDLPPIASDELEQGYINNADTLLIVVEKIDEIKYVLDQIKSPLIAKKPKLVVFNKIDQYSENIKRKITETLRSRRYSYVLVSAVTAEGLEELKEKLFKTFPIIRIYTRQPGKREDNVPVVLPPGSSLKDVAEKILHGYSKSVKYAKVYGPSSKFLGQKVGLKHLVKDKDIIELYTE